MLGVQKLSDVGCYVGTIGNAHALTLTVQSILTQSHLPRAVTVFDCSEVGVGRDYYYQQLGQVATLFGVEVVTRVVGPTPLDKMYDRMLDDAIATDKLKYMWLCNDDVLYMPHCLKHLHTVAEDSAEVSAVCGTKPDITNQRGYKDWSRKVRHIEDCFDGAPPYAIYDTLSLAAVRRQHLDLGNALIRVSAVNELGVRFEIDRSCDETSFGEDWVWAARMKKQGLVTVFSPSATAFHLDKPSGSPFGRYSTERQLLETRLRGQSLPLDVLDEWGAS